MQSPMEPRGKYAIDICEADGCEKQAHMSNNGFDFCRSATAPTRRSSGPARRSSARTRDPPSSRSPRQIKAARAAIRAANNVKAPVLTR